MKNENERLISVCVYCDSTGLFTPKEYEADNLVDMFFPVWIVKAWYKKNEEDLASACEAEGYEPDAYNWWKYVSTADDTDGLYDFAVEKGYDPVFSKEFNFKRNAIVYENMNCETVVVFKGNNLECRKWAREHNWKYEFWYTSLETLEEEIVKTDLEMLFIN